MFSAFDRDTAAKATRRAAVNDKRNLAGLEPLPADTPTAEEASWRGGPGFCVQLSNLTLDAMLADEQLQGFAYTAAVVGDGSWDPRAQRIARAALLHDGTRLGGALTTDDLIGGSSSGSTTCLFYRDLGARWPSAWQNANAQTTETPRRWRLGCQ